MKIEYILDKNDFLEHQLYESSKSPTMTKTRFAGRIRIPVIYFILAFIIYILVDILFAAIFIGIGILWYFAYPYFIRKKFTKHYDKLVQEYFKNRFGKQVSLVFGDEFIETFDSEAESKLRISEIDEIIEIENYYFIKMASGFSLIIPKLQIRNLNELKDTLSNLVRNFKIKHHIELDWKWN